MNENNAAATSDQSVVTHNDYLFVGGNAHGKTIEVVGLHYEIEAEGDVYHVRALHIGESWNRIFVLKSLGNLDAVNLVLTLAMRACG